MNCPSVFFDGSTYSPRCMSTRMRTRAASASLRVRNPLCVFCLRRPVAGSQGSSTVTYQRFPRLWTLPVIASPRHQHKAWARESPTRSAHAFAASRSAFFFARHSR